MGLSAQRLVRTRHTFRGQDMRKFGQPGPEKMLRHFLKPSYVDWHLSCMDGMFKGLNKNNPIDFISSMQKVWL